MATKICKGCNEELPLDNFGNSKMTKDGKEGKCRHCRKSQRPKYKLKCGECGGKFVSARQDAKFCSQKCTGLHRQSRVIVNCAFCSKPKEVATYYSKQVETHYCNQSCRSEHLKVLMIGENNPNYSRVNVPCSGCGEVMSIHPYRIEKHKYHYCSKDCFKEHCGSLRKGKLNPFYKEPLDVNCDGCGISFQRKPFEVKQSTRNFCSKDCYLNNYCKKKTRNLTETSCAECGTTVKRYQRIINTQNFVYCSYRCKNSHASKIYVGENSVNWNPFLSAEDRAKNRGIPGYDEWRLAVYKRDKFTCVCCGDSKGGNLIAHHKDGYHWAKERRIDVTNGVTLCESCHSDFHKTYGFTNNTERQFEDWIMNNRR